MKGTVVVLDQIAGRAAAALIIDGNLADFLIDPPQEAPLQAGAILRGVVDRQMKGQGGVFVRLPDDTRGFLKQVGGLAPGDRVLVKVTGHAEPGKALPVTMRVLFKSRYCIVTPGVAGLNISRQIRDEALRDDLGALAEAAMQGAPETLGLILRSVCRVAEDDVIAQDIAMMRDLAEKIGNDLEGPPELLLDAPGAQELAWRDWVDPIPDEVIDTPRAFDQLGVRDMLDALRGPSVALDNGAGMMIEPTRALVAVDVNTGPDSSPAAGFKANLAAARALPRQLLLRGLGGQITVDFAPMPKRDRHVLEQTLRAAFRQEGSETTLPGWTPLGNFEIQRKRDRMPLSESLPQ